MSNNRTVARARFTARLFARGLFVGLLGLALTIAIMSFLTACECVDRFFVRPDDKITHPPSDIKTITTPNGTTTIPASSNLPVIPQSSDKKDN